MNNCALILKAAVFAAERHKSQRRKGAAASPYINHPLGVAELLAGAGGVSDPLVLAAAVLHDTIEDTRTTPAELEEHFGAEVCRLVEEVTDDKSLPKQERKRLQIAHAPAMSAGAKLIKLGDKIANVKDVVADPPADWPLQRRLEYLDWTEQVVVGCRGVNENLERLYDEALRTGRAVLAQAEKH
jgi:guanosine-3',5'-bis(diphosphate) 3'-pyrophosphohydrolase